MKVGQGRHVSRLRVLQKTVESIRSARIPQKLQQLGSHVQVWVSIPEEHLLLWKSHKIHFVDAISSKCIRKAVQYQQALLPSFYPPTPHGFSSIPTAHLFFLYRKNRSNHGIAPNTPSGITRSSSEPRQNNQELKYFSQELTGNKHHDSN